MGFISDAINGVVGGVEDAFGAKNHFQAQQGYTPDQISQTYGQGQDIYGRQTSVADVLAQRGQNGSPIDFSAANATLGTGNDLLTQLMAQGNGVGPNPALEQLKQTTSANINNAAGMAASARGVNPALAARLSVNAAGGANQTAAGQAAIMTAQQQIAARQLASHLVGQQAGQQAGMAQAQAGQQTANIQQWIQQLAQLQGGNLNLQQIQQGALQGQNQINSGVAGQNAGLGAKLMGGAFQGLGATGAMGAGIQSAAGGVPAAAHGGEITPTGVRTDKDVAAGILAKTTPAPAAEQKKPRSDKDIAREILFSRGGKVPKGAPAAAAPRGSSDKAVAAQVVMRRYFGGGQAPYAAGGPVQAPMLAPPAAAPNGPASHLGRLLSGMAHGGPVFMSRGVPAVVPGHAQVPGDSSRNDVVDAKLSPGEGVLPRSVMQAPDAPEKAKSFVEHLVKSRKPAKGFRRVVEARKRADAR